MALEEPAARADDDEAAGRLPEAVTAEVDAGVAQEVADGGTVVGETPGEAREELLQDLVATGQQRVGVACLGNGTSGLESAGKVVPIHDDDLAVTVVEHLCGQQSHDAGAEHDGAISDRDRHHLSPPRR
jgi:hypothetical protein